MKATTNSTYKLGGLITLIRRYRVFYSSNPSHTTHRRISFSRFGYCHDGTTPLHRGAGLNMFTTLNNPQPNKVQTSKEIVHVTDRPSLRPRAAYFVWAKWLFGSVLPVLLAIWQQKWSNILTLEGKVEKVGEEVENVAEVIEKVATTTEKVAAEVAEALNQGKLKEAALTVEHVSSVTAKDAQVTKDFIDKVGDLKKELKDLQSIAEPVIDKIIHGPN